MNRETKREFEKALKKAEDKLPDPKTDISIYNVTLPLPEYITLHFSAEQIIATYIKDYKNHKPIWVRETHSTIDAILNIY